MSMCLYIKSGGEMDLTRLARNPDKLMAGAMEAFGGAQGLGGSRPDPEALARMRRELDIEARKSGFVGGLIMRLTTGRMLKQFEERLQAANDDGGEDGNTEGGATLDLHKSWHVLHFLFTGTAWEGKSPADALLNGGKEVGEDLGYGPARLLDPKTTAAFAAFLGARTTDQLLAKIDIARMSALEIYGAEDDDPDRAEELVEDVRECFPALRDFVAAAAAKGEGLLIWMA